MNICKILSEQDQKLPKTEKRLMMAASVRGSVGSEGSPQFQSAKIKLNFWMLLWSLPISCPHSGFKGALGL